jgi:hypothetical protein
MSNWNVTAILFDTADHVGGVTLLIRATPPGSKT